MAFTDYDRARWAASRVVAPPTSGAGGEIVALDEMVEIYGPLAATIVDDAGAARNGAAPYIVSVVGSVAVGKSTSARALRTMLGELLGAESVDLVATDGFLMTNRELEARGLTDRKGFPDSFRREAFAKFITDVKRGVPELKVPRYSHDVYDVVADTQIVRHPRVLLLEGLPLEAAGIDLWVYLDADEPVIVEWFVARFLALRRAAFDEPDSFFDRFTRLSEEQTEALAREVWNTVNRVNLHEHILPVRDTCNVVLWKASDHSVQRVRLRGG
jgi:type I pantothenate kinase